jgi:hypothetical protein
MGALRRQDGAIDFARTRFRDPLQGIRDMPQECIALIVSNMLTSGKNGVELGIGQPDRRHEGSSHKVLAR